MISLDSPVRTVTGDLKKKQSDALVKLRIHTVGDLLRHLPRRYLATGELTRLDELEEGQVLSLVGVITASKVVPYHDRRTGRTAYRLETILRTDGDSLRMTFFAKHAGVSQSQARKLAAGQRGIFLGKVSRFRDEWQLGHPQMLMLGRDIDEIPPEIGPLFPLYKLSEGIESWDLQRAVTFARTVLDELPELLPAPVRSAYDVLDAHTTLDWIHAPADRGQVARAQRRYRFEEALVAQLVLARRRRALRALGAQARTGGDGALLTAFDARLPFELTAGQREIGSQLEHDLAQPHPMNRLLQGEVGSGKTLVALRAMLRVVDSGGQAALLAPTEVLAQQHHRSITALLGDLAAGGMLGGAVDGTSVELLTGSMTKAQRTQPMSRAAIGEAGIVIGTHALLEERVQFFDLGLVVVDEQHRFGVEQRAALTDKAGSPPHVLVMTATPIPRTVAMTVFGDLETSVLRELPAGRAPIQTTVVPLIDHPSWVERAWQRVREEVAAGHQAYVVCPRITSDQVEEGSGPDALGLSSVDDVAAELQDGPLAGLRVGRLHGRLHPDEKDRTMRAFAAGEIDVLVSTTVIEVGVDVANATAMVLLDADRFGISQLHQLRGRVGRGGLPGLCLLVTHAGPGPARERLDAVAATSDGFELSRVDLEQRQEGDVLGQAQSGWRSGLQNLRVLRDEKTIVEAREAAETLLDEDPEIAHPPLAEAVAEMEATVQAEFLERS